MGYAFPEKPVAHLAQEPGEQSELADEAIIHHFTATTLGEHLIPLLLLVGEVCVGYVILLGLAVSLNFAGDANPLLPFWGLLLIMLSFYGLSGLFQRRSPTGLARKVMEPLTWLPLALCLSLFFVWLNNYAQTISLFSLQWLLALLHDFIPAIQLVVLFLVAGISGWRGYRLAQKHFMSDDIDRLFKLGIAVLLIVIGIFLFQFYVKAADLMYITHLSPQIPALLTATFFICMLTARALQNVSYMRHFHSAKLWGSAARQERMIWLSMTLLGLVIVTIAHFLGQAAIVISQSHILLRKRKDLKSGRLSGPGGQFHPHSAPSIMFIIILIVIASIVFFLIILWLWLRFQKLQRLAKQPKKQKVREEKENIDEIHETVFSWSLFLAQLLAILTRLNPFRKRHRSSAASMFDDLRLTEPMARSIREIYRALLKKAANRGQARAQDETPYEFWQRLSQQEMLAQALPEAEAITEAYVLVRYSGSRPGEREVARVKQLWGELKQKWL